MWKPEKYIQIFLSSEASATHKQGIKNVFINLTLPLITYQKGSLSLYCLYGFVHYVKAQLFTRRVLTHIPSIGFTIHITYLSPQFVLKQRIWLRLIVLSELCSLFVSQIHQFILLWVAVSKLPQIVFPHIIALCKKGYASIQGSSLGQCIQERPFCNFNLLSLKCL